MQKKVLLTNFAIRDYTGSEIDTLDIGEYFLKQGYKVDIFTLNFNNPLKEKVNKEISVYTYDDAEKLSKQYDLIWSHHFPLLDYLIFDRKIQAPYINHVSLSSFEPLEFPPVYYKELSNICVVSKEAKDVYVKELGLEESDVFPNYLPEEFLNAQPKQVKSLNKICIISNHVPDEIVECAKMFNEENIQTDIYGMGHKWEKITPEILNKYDLIITIGKSVLYALYLKIPCFVYDYFGGDLFLDKENIEKAFNYNFSGRASKIKMTAKELNLYIKENFNKSLDSLQENKEFIENNCILEKNIKSILDKVYTKKVDYEKLFEKFGYLKNYTKPYVRDVFYRNNMHQIELTNNIISLELLSKKDEEIAELRKQINEMGIQKEKVNEEMFRIKNSKSWKITKPLRDIYSTFKNVKTKNK